jgi:serine/threonine protein kinase
MEYAIEKVLGGGGFGITYLARDLNLSLLVALKEYLPADLAMRAADGTVTPLGEASADDFLWGLERFIDEARALATFSHRNIVRVLRYFAVNGTAYIVMEYQSGYSLKQWLPRHTPLGRGDLLNLILPLLDGLELIHQAGFLHRDIKPDNIFMRGDGTPVLIDFGAARRTTTGQDLTKIITPGFAPFEQYHSKGNQGPWSDLYSLAAVMYWIVSGEKPLESASRLKRDDMVPAARSDHHQLIGEPILGAIDWALSLDEQRRPQSVAAFRARLLGDTGHETRKLEADDMTIPLSRMTQARDMPPRTAPGAGPLTQEGARGNLVCTVLFLDIVAYSKASVSEQYELKNRFNHLIAANLSPDREAERITLDTGDGAAICFMGDPEEVLAIALRIRRGFTPEDRLKVRMGLHIGPVRVLNDLNGRGNVIGDGINSAQRVMSFSNEHSLLVSRAFYDVVSCLAENGEAAFRYIGAEQDKHGRSHELYEVLLDDGQSRLFQQQRRNADPLSRVREEIDPGQLATIEHDLAQHMGPLAPVLIRKVLARATDAGQLRELLAPSISDPQQREAFRIGQPARRQESSSTRRAHAPDQPTSMQRTSVKPTAPTPTQPSRSPSTTGAPSLSKSSASLKPWLSPEILDELEKQLARALGPVARVLIKSEAKKAGDLAALTQALAAHVENPGSRSQFLAAIAGLRAPSPGREDPSLSRRVPQPATSLPQSATNDVTSLLGTDREIATVLITDICDSTSHAMRMGDRRWRTILTHHHELVRAELARFGGREVDTAGDGFFAIFQGPARAVRCACTIRDAVRMLGIEIRAGIHTGELEMVGEKAGGIAVHIGARVAGLAQANEVLVSSTVKELIAGSNIKLFDHGHHQLKGLEGTWQLFVAESPAAPPFSAA